MMARLNMNKFSNLLYFDSSSEKKSEFLVTIDSAKGDRILKKLKATRFRGQS
jgi:hypothetical protein